MEKRGTHFITITITGCHQLQWPRGPPDPAYKSIHSTHSNQIYTGVTHICPPPSPSVRHIIPTMLAIVCGRRPARTLSCCRVAPAAAFRPRWNWPTCTLSAAVSDGIWLSRSVEKCSDSRWDVWRRRGAGQKSGWTHSGGTRGSGTPPDHVTSLDQRSRSVIAAFTSGFCFVTQSEIRYAASRLGMCKGRSLMMS